MNVPLLSATIMFIAGIAMGEFAEADWVGVSASAILVLIASLVWFRARRVLIYCGVFLAGWANHSVRVTVVSPDDLRVIFAEQPAIVTVEGRLLETPVTSIARTADAPRRSRASMEVWQVTVDGVARRASGKVLAMTDGIVSQDFYIGREVRVTGVIMKPPVAAAEGLFDYRRFLRLKAMDYQLVSAGEAEWELASTSTGQPPLGERFHRWARKALVHGLDADDSITKLTLAMSLGWRPGMGAEDAELFMRSGTMHIFAISGLHITLIAGILIALFRVLQFPTSACGLLALPLIWFYTGATGWEASAIRASVMSTVFIAGRALKKPQDMLSTLCFSALLILVWDPLQLFQAGFQLSFVAVLSIVVLVPLFEPHRAKWVAGDPMLPVSARSLFRRALDFLLDWGSLLALVTLTVWVGTAPITADVFHLFTLSGLIANLVVVPLSGLGLMCNLCSLLCYGWAPFASELFNHSAWGWMCLMESICRWSADLPGGYLFVPGLSRFDFLVFYSALLTVVALQSYRRMWLVISLGALIAVWAGDRLADRSHHELTFVSGRNGMLHDAPGAKQNLLIDPESGNIDRLLQSRGMNRFPDVLVTHGDRLHYGGVAGLNRSHPQLRLFVGDTEPKSRAFRKLLEEFRAKQVQIQSVSRGDRLHGWQVLHPAPVLFSRADDNAVVLSGNFNGVRVLLLSDLGAEGQKSLLASNQDLRCEIVVTGIPSQGVALGQELLDAMQPQLVLIANESDARTRRAERDLFQRVWRTVPTVISLTEAGSVTMEFRRSGCELRSMNGRRVAVTPSRPTQKSGQ